jgi:RHS repeat-associated protein
MNDNEVKGGLGNQQDYGFRIYDPRIGKFLSVDPLTKDYPWYTPYQFAGNMSISAIDLDGSEPKTMVTNNGRLTEPMIKLLTTAYNYEEQTVRSTRFNWTNKKVTLPNHVFAETTRGGKILINRYWQYSYPGYSSSYEMFWLNTIGHEVTHVYQYSKINPIPTSLEGRLEVEGYFRGDRLQEFIEKNNNGNLFDTRWSEQERTGYAEYLGLSNRAEGLNVMITMNTDKVNDLKNKLAKSDNAKEKKSLTDQLKTTTQSIDRQKRLLESTNKQKAEVEKKNNKIINITYNF